MTCKASCRYLLDGFLVVANILHSVPRISCGFSLVPFISNTIMVLPTLALVIVIISATYVRASCYLRNGVASPRAGLRICGNGSHTCWWPGQKCGSNLLCSDASKLSREFCDNKEWHGCSPLGAEVLETGIALYQCETNTICYNNTACCINGDPIYYVDPMTGDVQNATGTNISKASPIWWDPLRSSDESTHNVPIVTLVAIVTGCAAAGIGLAVLAWKLLFRRKRRDWAQKLVKAQEEYGNHGAKAGPRINQHHADESLRQELHSQSRRFGELESRPRAAELESQPRRVHELDPQPNKMQELP